MQTDEEITHRAVDRLLRLQGDLWIPERTVARVIEIITEAVATARSEGELDCHARGRSTDAVGDLMGRIVTMRKNAR